MSNCAISLTPTDLEMRLAALGIPVARLIAAAHIARSTWSAWQAGRTRPRPDRWSAATEAFAALVAEAEAAPPAALAEPSGADVVPLAGSSPSTGAPPSFTPVATAPAPIATDPDAATIAAADRAAALARREWASIGLTVRTEERRGSRPGPRTEMADRAANRLSMRLHRRLRSSCRALAGRPAMTPAAVAAKARATLAVKEATASDPWWTALRDSTLRDAARLDRAAEAPSFAPIAAAPALDLAGEGLAFRSALEACLRLDAMCGFSIAVLDCVDKGFLARGVPEALYLVDGEALGDDVGVSYLGEREWFGHVESLAELRRLAPDWPRAAEVLAAHDAWACERGEAEPTRAWSDAWSHNRDLVDRWSEAYGALMMAEARTLDGIMAKAAVAFANGAAPPGGTSMGSTLARVERSMRADMDRGINPMFETAAGCDLLRMAIRRGLPALVPHGGGATPGGAPDAVADLTAEWSHEAAWDTRMRRAVGDLVSGAPRHDEIWNEARQRSASYVAVLRRVADQRCSHAAGLALKAAAVVAACNETGLDRSIADAKVDDLGEMEHAVALSLVRDVFDMLGAPARRLADAALHPAEMPIAGKPTPLDARAAA